MRKPLAGTVQTWVESDAILRQGSTEFLAQTELAPVGMLGQMGRTLRPVPGRFL